MLVRPGIPYCFRRMCAAAKAIDAPILVSANAFRRRGQVTFSHPAPDLFAGCPVALDSTGFVATRLYGGYLWSVAEYVDLAGSYPWDWWSQMDYCCEPEIAADVAEVRRRLEMTALMLRECRLAAADRGVSPPMPIVQGWRPDDYAESLYLAGSLLGELPPLIGVGSVCRSHLSGPDGLFAVIERLDVLLSDVAPQTRLHLFGVKSDALAHLRGHSRIASIDSMAHNYRARKHAREQRRSCTIA